MPATRSAAISGKLRDERLHRDAAHRVTDEHRAVQVETFDDGAHVCGEVLERVPGAPDHRLPVTAVVERDRAEARPRQRLELVEPRADRDRDAVREHDRRARRPTRRGRSNRRRTRRAADRRRPARRARAPRRRRGGCRSRRASDALPRVARARRAAPAAPTRDAGDLREHHARRRLTAGTTAARGARCRTRSCTRWCPSRGPTPRR